MTNGQSGRARLAQWIQRSKLNQIEASRVIGIHVTQLSQILAGNRRPGLDNAVKIETTTGIPVEAWVPTPVGTAIDETPESTPDAAISKA